MKKRRGLKRYYRKLNKLNVCDGWLDALSEDDTWFNLAMSILTGPDTGIYHGRNIGNI